MLNPLIFVGHPESCHCWKAVDLNLQIMFSTGSSDAINRVATNDSLFYGEIDNFFAICSGNASFATIIDKVFDLRYDSDM